MKHTILLISYTILLVATLHLHTLAFYSQSNNVRIPRFSLGKKIRSKQAIIGLPTQQYDNKIEFIFHATSDPSSSSSSTSNDSDSSNDDSNVSTLSEGKASSIRKQPLPTTPPWFKVDGKRIRRRIELNDLKVGQKIQGIKLEHEWLLGKTGPKVYLDCGVTKYDANKEHYNKIWSRVNAMMRVGFKYEKKSIHRKRAAKLAKKGLTDVYVSRIFVDNGQLEVSLDPIKNDNKQKKKISMSSIQPNNNHEYIGIVKRIESYGALVDIGTNRLGLLHIQKVADIYNRYIDKEKGLQESGLEVGAKIRVQVVEKDKRRIFLDFTNDVKQDAIAQVQKLEEEKNKVDNNDNDNQLSEEDAAEWAAFAAADNNPSTEDDDEEDDDSDYYDASAWEEFATNSNNDDEDRKIEDALGLGSY